MNEYRHIDIEGLRLLAQKYFDASITIEETAELLAAVSAPGSLGHIAKTDPELASDISLILHIYSLPSAGACTAVPDGLEERLDRHISILARKPRSLFRKWVIAASSAAAAAIIAITTVSIHDSSQPSGIASADSAELFPELTLSLPSAGEAAGIASIDKADTDAPLPAEQTERHAASPLRKRVPASPRKVSAAQLETVVSAEATISAAMPDIASLPYFAEPVAEIVPAIAAATIDPVNIMIQPLSTISQSFDNVYESLDIVSKAFSDVNTVIKDAAQSVETASLPLHSI